MSADRLVWLSESLAVDRAHIVSARWHTLSHAMYSSLSRAGVRAVTVTLDTGASHEIRVVEEKMPPDFGETVEQASEFDARARDWIERLRATADLDV